LEELYKSDFVQAGGGGGTRREEQCLIDQGIIGHRTMGGRSLRPAVFQDKNTTFRGGYIGLNGWSRGRVGREVLDIRLEEKTITTGYN
jgi:hypothetical protein